MFAAIAHLQVSIVLFFVKASHETDARDNGGYFTFQEDFDIFLTPAEYDDPVVRDKFSQQLITAYENTQAWRRSGKQHPDKVSSNRVDDNTTIANDPDGKTKSLSTEAGLHRLARQLQKTEQELWANLALRALDAGDVEKALKILGYEFNNMTSNMFVFCRR